MQILATRCSKVLGGLPTAVAVLLLGALPASALMSGAGNSTTGASCNGGGGGDGDCRNSVSFTAACGASCSTFTSRYAWNINADTTVFSTHDTSGNAQHNVSFSATATGGYRLDISTSRVGAMGRSSDATGCDGAADTSGVTGNSNVALNSGTLTIGDPGAIANGGGDANTPYNQSSGTAQIFRFSGGVAQSHSLSFTWNGSVRSNSCEASVRQGESSGTTSGCDVCGYPGNPSRTQASDGHFVTVSFTSLCGNGAVEAAAGEDCDTGIAGSVCCTSQCKFATSGTCRAAAGECDLAESCNGAQATCPADAKKTSGTACTADTNPCTLDQCDGTNVTCQHPAGNAGATCRASAGTCDVVETCTGLSTTCPADAFSSSSTSCRGAAGECDLQENCTGSTAACPADARKPNGTACSSDGNPCTLDRCDGTNVTCQHPAGNAGATCRAAAGVCDVAETCTGTTTACPADAKSTALCRASAGSCDVAENCDGVNDDCPANAFQSSSVTCRASAGDCDVAENCTGAGAACPADAVRPNTFQCRSSAGVCDPAENCTGSTVTCPVDAKSTAVCRASGGVCDVADSCDGVNNDCPADAFVSGSTECRASAGVCDVAENCTGSTAACPADAFQSSSTQCRASAGVCDVAETCTGSTAACPADSVAGAFVVCRASAGVCDTAENCDGVGVDCPADAKSTAQCRAAAGVCDVSENCDGVNDDCPADAFQSGSTQCRASAGFCDVAENCTGSTAACPADAFQSSSTVCRGSAGVCDVAENCTGSGPNCPADSVAGAFVQCRAAAGVCDQAENCDGVNTACPANTFQPTTTVCRPAAGVCDVADNCDGSGNCSADAKSTAVCRAASGFCDLAESCDGTSNNCPTDAFKPIGTTCRAAASVCDVAEVCTGLSGACPSDVFVPNNTPCNDGNACTTPDSCQNGACVGTPAPQTCADDFMCYKAKANAFTAIPNVQLADQFENVSVTVVKPKTLCPPANTGGGITDANTHLKAYSIKQATRHTRRQNLQIDNQFGTIHVDTIKPDLLLVPSNKSLVTPPSAPNENAIDVNHYKCYKVKVTAGTPKFPKGTQASVSDQFTSPAKTYDLKKVRHLCTPVSKNGGVVHEPDVHLLCYQAKAAKGQPRHNRTTAFVNNQFGPETMTTIKESELCVPSLKTLP